MLSAFRMCGDRRHGESSMTRASVLWSFIACVTCVLACATELGAQTYQGALRGAVRDPQGVIPGAEVVLINEDTNAARSAMTNEVGEYAFPSVLPGPYTVSVSLPGFKTEERKGFRIGTQQSAVLDFTLEVGAIASRSTVTGEAPLVERASATQAASLDKEALQNLPIFGRNTFLRGHLDARASSRPATRSSCAIRISRARRSSRSAAARAAATATCSKACRSPI